MSDTSDSTVAAVRCMVIFWGTSGAGIRCSHRIGTELIEHFGASHVMFSLHANNAWLDAARAISGDVDIVEGTVGHLSFGSILLNLPRQLLQLRRTIKRFDPDVIVIPMNFAQAWAIGALATWLGKKLVYVIHDAWPHPGDYARLFQILSQNALIKQATLTVAMSKFVGENARISLPAKRRAAMRIAPLGKLVPRVVTTPRELDKGPVRFLFLGRLLQYKGLDILAEAVSQLADRYDWRLTIAGNGNEREFVINAFSQYPQVDLQKLVWLLEAEVDTLMETHDVIVCPYLEASQSGVIAEGCGYGLPAVVTPVGALPEQIGYGKAGWVTRTATSAAIAEAMIAVLNDRSVYSKKSAAALDMASPSPGATEWSDMVSSLAMAK